MKNMKKYTYLEVKQMYEKFDNGEISQEEFDAFRAEVNIWFDTEVYPQFIF